MRWKASYLEGEEGETRRGMCQRVVFISLLFSSLLSSLSLSLFHRSVSLEYCFSLFLVLPGSEVLSNEANVLLRGEAEIHSGDVGDALPVGGEEHVQRDALLLQLAHADGEVCGRVESGVCCLCGSSGAAAGDSCKKGSTRTMPIIAYTRIRNTHTHERRTRKQRAHTRTRKHRAHMAPHST